MEGNGDTNCSWNDLSGFDKGAGSVENQKMGRDHPNYSIIKIGQNTEKSPGDLLSLTRAKDQQLMLV